MFNLLIYVGFLRHPLRKNSEVPDEETLDTRRIQDFGQ